MALPQKLKAARMTDGTVGTTIDDKVGELEGVLADILGITIDVDVAVSPFSLNNSGQITKALVAQRAAGPVGWRFRDTVSGKEARIVVNGTNLDIDENVQPPGTEGSPSWTNRLRMAIATGALSGAVATTSADGLCPAGDGNAAHYLDGTLNFSLPSAVSGPSLRVWRSSNQSLGTGGVLPIGLQSIGFDQESWDTDNMHSNVTNNSYITAVTAGYYMFTGQVDFDANANGYRLLRLIKNSSTTFGEATSKPITDTSRETILQVRGFVHMGVGEVVSLYAYQNSGSSLNALGGNEDTWLAAHKIA